jgi:hypothetical protein
MIKQSTYTYGGMLRDLSKSKFPNTKYYDAKNIRVLATGEETSFSLTTEKGNTLSYQVADYYGTPAHILGHCTIDDYLILFVYYTSTYQAVKRIKISNGGQYTCIGGDLNFQLGTYFSTEVFYENENTLKVYWADGINPLRYLNILDETVASKPISLLDACPTFIVSSPVLDTSKGDEGISWGGKHTAGMIQYCYNLIVKGGAQSKISPRSELIPLKKPIGGGDVDEIVGQINHIKIDNVDTKFDIIRLYSVKYTSYNQSPTVSLIAEETISKTGELTTTIRFDDDGTVISNSSEKELMFLGGENLIPAHIASKFNYLILGDIKENYFDVPIEDYDTRAYRFQKEKTSTKIKNKDKAYEDIHFATIEATSTIVYSGGDKDGQIIDYTHDCINDELTINASQVVVENSTQTRIETMEFNSPENAIEFTEIPSGSYIVKIYATIDNIDVSFVSPVTEVDALSDLMTYCWNVFKSGVMTPDGYTISSRLDMHDAQLLVFYRVEDSNGDTVEIDSYVEVWTYSTTSTISTVNNIADIYAYTYNDDSFGARGTNVELRIISTPVTEVTNILKSREIYRFAIEFYNDRGQFTEPKWVADLYIPDAPKEANRVNALQVTLRNLNLLRSLGVVGWNVLRVERTDADKTIITQGIINPCIFQKTSGLTQPDEPTQLSQESGLRTGKEASIVNSTETFTKLPSQHMRNVADMLDSSITTQGATSLPWPFSLFADDPILYGNTFSPTIKGIKNGGYISYPAMTDDAVNLNFPFAEIFKQYRDGKYTTHDSYEFTKMFQLYSPEITFLNPIFGNGLKYSVVGKLNNGSPLKDSLDNIIGLNDCAVWGKQIATADAEYVIHGDNALSSDDDATITIKKGDVISDIRLRNHFHLFNEGVVREGDETYSALHKNGLIGPSGARSPRQNLYQYYRKYTLDSGYTNTYLKNNVEGNPIVIGKGESSKVYNSTSLTNVERDYTFHNHLFTLIADRNSVEPKETEVPLICVNSIGADCLNLVDADQIELENILSTYGITGDATALVEISRILTNQYGGNTYEARSRNSYLRIGTYKAITETAVVSNNIILRPGDTFISNYKFLRIIPNIAQVENNRYTAICEIVEFPVESSINNTCRNDYSLNSWDSNWHPSFDEYHNYNRVYSQEPISNINTATPFTFEQVKHSSVRLLSTKVKTPGEIIDSWTDILINEELNLNGQFGKLTKLIRNNDNLYFFQDNALGIVQVQPRVAIQASDGIGVELGTGQILYNYQYLSTASGSTNPNCIFNSPNFVYYVDVTNRTLNRVSDQVQGLSDGAGFHAYMYNNILQSYDNSLELVGVFDNINDEAYFTTPAFTITYNETMETFTSFYSFIPKMYIKTPGRLFSCANYNGIYEHFTGDYCNFYGTVYDSYITFLMNPEYNSSKLFNNLNFKTELYDGNSDEFSTDGINFTLPIESVRVWNEYQDTGTVNLVYNTNIARKFRDWNLWIPRSQANILERIRGNSIYCQLNISNDNNYKLILHDINLLYGI